MSDPTMSESMTLRSFGYEQELKRSLSLADPMIYGVVFMVPIAPFAIFGVVFNGSKGMVPLTYLIGLVAMLFTALSYREMSRAFPIAGSVYSYAGRGINDNVGFMAGWAILLDYLLVPTLLYVVSAAAPASLVPGLPARVWVVAFVLINTVVNYLGIESTARLNRLFLLGELIVLALFVVFGIAAIAASKNGAHFSFAPLLKPHLVTPGLIFGALSIAVLSFLGFDGISTLSEEVKDGGRRLAQDDGRGHLGARRRDRQLPRGAGRDVTPAVQHGQGPQAARLPGRTSTRRGRSPNAPSCSYKRTGRGTALSLED